MHVEIKDYGTGDGFFNFIEKDAKGARLLQEWRKLIDLNTHFDEFVVEISLGTSTFPQMTLEIQDNARLI
jgi:hypothetical protein